MKLKNILNEILSEGRSEAIDIAEAESILQSDCKSFDFDQTDHIYRGVSYDYETMVIDPSLFDRTSANTKNYYTYIIDNSDRWNNFPKRSKSVVCTTSYDKASAYGTRYLVIPFDQAKLGVAPESDIFYSFEDVGSKFEGPGHLNEYLDMLHREMVGIPLSDDTKAEFFEGLDQLTKAVNSKDGFNGTRFPAAEILFDEYKSSTASSFRGYLEQLLDPNENGFEITYQDTGLNLPNNREVWTSAPCLMVRYDIAETFFN